MLVLIGKGWLDAKDEDSEYVRLINEEDWVRREIECGRKEEKKDHYSHILFTKSGIPTKGSLNYVERKCKIS